MPGYKAQGHQLVTRARKGDTGPTGISYRVSFWQAGKEYRNDTNNTTASERIIDICVNMSISMIGDSNFRAYQCVSTHTSDATTNTLGKAGLWVSINNLKPLVSPLILANKIVANYIDVADLAANTAFISALTVNKLTVKNANNNVIAKIGDMDDYNVGGVQGKYPLWIGGATPANAVTRIDSTGKLTTTNIVASGGTIGGFTIGSGYIGVSSSGPGTPSGNGMSLYSEFISFYESSSNTYSGGTFHTLIGTSVLSAVTGLRALARFANNATGSSLAYDTGYGIMCDVSGYRNNYAIYCNNGVFAGFRPWIELDNDGRTLGAMDSVIHCSNESACTFYLPSNPQHGQMYAIIHTTTTKVTISGSTTHPIRRVSVSSSGWATSHESTSQEVILVIYDAHSQVTFNSATRTGLWFLTYLKVA